MVTQPNSDPGPGLIPLLLVVVIIMAIMITIAEMIRP